MLCALAVAVPLVACGSAPEPGPAPATTPTDSPAPTTAEHGAYAQCLREHNITQTPTAAPGPAPGPAAAPPGVDPAEWEQAVAACAEFAPGPVG